MLIYLLIPIVVCRYGGLCKVDKAEPFILQTTKQYLFYPEENVYLTKIKPQRTRIIDDGDHMPAAAEADYITYVLYAGAIDETKPVYDTSSMFDHPRINFECFHYNTYNHAAFVSQLSLVNATQFTQFLKLPTKLNETNKWMINLSKYLDNTNSKRLAIVLEHDYTNELSGRVRFSSNDDMLYRQLMCQFNKVSEINFLQVVIERHWNGRKFCRMRTWPRRSFTASSTRTRSCSGSRSFYSSCSISR